MNDPIAFVAICSFPLPGGPLISSTEPLFNPPPSNLSRGGHLVEKCKFALISTAADCVMGKVPAAEARVAEKTSWWTWDGIFNTAESGFGRVPDVSL